MLREANKTHNTRDVTKQKEDHMSSDKTIYLSKKGMKELKKKIARLERDRKEALTRLKEIEKTDGHDERLDRATQFATIDILESELADARMVLKDATLMKRKRNVLKVAIGSVVDLIDTSGRMVRYRLVESIEANPSDGRISIKSPLGKNLLGKQIQDIVEWTATLGPKRLQLVAIQ